MLNPIVKTIFYSFSGSIPRSLLRGCFIPPDNKFRKTFTLAGNTIQAQYEATGLGGASLFFGFRLPVNLGNMFSMNWWESLEKISTPEVVGWKYITGGYAVINLMDTQLLDTYSFADSPAREEMKERGPEDDPPTRLTKKWSGRGKQGMIFIMVTFPTSRLR